MSSTVHHPQIWKPLNMCRTLLVYYSSCSTTGSLWAPDGPRKRCDHFTQEQIRHLIWEGTQLVKGDTMHITDNTTWSRPLIEHHFVIWNKLHCFFPGNVFINKQLRMLLEWRQEWYLQVLRVQNIDVREVISSYSNEVQNLQGTIRTRT